jgi:hypothetical protein
VLPVFLPLRSLLGILWDLGEDEFNVWGPHLGPLRSDIQRHVIRFPDDWLTEDLFEQLRAFEAPTSSIRLLP